MFLSAAVPAPHQPAAQFPEWHLGVPGSCSLRVRGTLTWYPQLPPCPRPSRKAGEEAKAGFPGACILQTFSDTFLNSWKGTAQFASSLVSSACFQGRKISSLHLARGGGWRGGLSSGGREQPPWSLQLPPGAMSCPLAYILFLLSCGGSIF